jgi:hypothetical protein
MLTTTTTTTTNTNTTTTTTTNTTNTKNNNTAQQQERLRDRWENRVTNALFRRMKRNALAANALFGTPAWVEPDMRSWSGDEGKASRRRQSWGRARRSRA